MSKKLFIAAPTETAFENWPICWTGTEDDGIHWVTTSRVRASMLHNYSGGAKSDAELIARLLNWYYNNENAESILQKAEEK